MNRNLWGEDPVLFHLRLVLKARELKLRGADDRRLRRWVARKWDEFRKRRFFVKSVLFGLGYGRGDFRAQERIQPKWKVNCVRTRAGTVPPHQAGGASARETARRGTKEERMKIRKLKGDWDYGIPVMCQAIIALKEARAVSPSVGGSAEFQGRCTDAIIALADKLMEDYVEKFYELETKKFLVTYDVKRSGTGELVVEAKDEAEAKAKAESQLKGFDDDWFNKRETDLNGVDVVDAKEYRDGQA